MQKTSRDCRQEHGAVLRLLGKGFFYASPNLPISALPFRVILQASRYKLPGFSPSRYFHTDRTYIKCLSEVYS